MSNHQALANTPYVQAIRHRLVILRLARDLKRTDIRGVGPEVMRYIEERSMWLRIPVLLACARAYHVSLAVLLTESWTDWPTAPPPTRMAADRPPTDDVADAFIRRNLRMRRNVAGLSAAIVAAKVGVNQSTIVRMESGESALHLGLVGAYATAMEFPIDLLFVPPRSPDVEPNRATDRATA